MKGSASIVMRSLIVLSVAIVSGVVCLLLPLDQTMMPCALRSADSLPPAPSHLLPEVVSLHGAGGNPCASHVLEERVEQVSERRVSLQVVEGVRARPLLATPLTVSVLDPATGYRAPAARYRTDSVGAASIDLPMGEVQLACGLRLPIGQEFYDVVAVGPSDSEVRLTIPEPAYLRGIVIDDVSGLPLAGARICHVDSDVVEAADSGGGFVVPCLEGAFATLVVTCEGYGVDFVQLPGERVRAAKMATQDPLVVRMRRAICVRGSIAPRSGSDTVVTLSPMGRVGVQPGVSIRASVGADGRFTIDGVPMSMRALLSIERDGVEVGRWGWRGADCDVDLGEIELWPTTKVHLKRDLASTRGVLQIHLESRPQLETSGEGLIAVPATEHVTMRASNVGADVTIAAGRVTVDGHGPDGRLAEVCFDGCGERSVDLEYVGSRTCRWSFAGVQRGTLLIKDPRGRVVEQALIHGEVAHLPPDALREADSIEYRRRAKQGWTKSVTAPVSAPVKTSYAERPDDCRIRGVIVAEEATSWFVVVEQVGAGRLASYFSSEVVSNSDWEVMVEGGREYRVRWKQIAAGARGASRLGSERSIGLVGANVDVVLR